MLADRDILRSRLRGFRQRLAAGRPIERALREAEELAQRSVQRLRRRLEQHPHPSFSPDLPVSEHRGRIAEAIAGHQVTVVCGETGSGKTTQIPKICLSLGRGAAGLIGHTQPRRIAARSVAARIAAELGTGTGPGVGYKVRFGDRTSPHDYLKLMTDGILLAETQGDRDLLAYDTIIVDEAHERNLNIDFLLGYLKRLLPRRPDLKLIITSATIDPARFAGHFGGAPVIEVPGRTYPVEVRYRPLAAEDEDTRELGLHEAILAAVDEVAREGPGDVLVFLPGEREIRDTAEGLRKHHPAGTEILPLFGRLSTAEQQRIFLPARQRRVVLATNVAETSLTVPGIRYVVDTGLARISRYSFHTKVQRLPIEPVSQASADQRRGRCGRVGPGICIRLYGEEDYHQRPVFTEPEILRINLAAVILQMAALKLGEVQSFPFLDPPDRRYVSDGYRLLQELGAMDGERRLTGLGRELARLPVDPRVGRMLLAARDEGCVAEMLVIASALSVQEPRERPLAARERADAAHDRFRDERSDFLAYLKLWEFYHQQARHLSRSKLRRLCRESFLSHVRMREWHDVHQQLTGLMHDMGVRENTLPATYEAIHRALLTGLLGNIGCREEGGQYLGVRGTRFSIFPGSGMVARPPKWVVAAEVVETSRLYARTVARIEPAWVEQAAGALCRRSYSEPHWEARGAQVAAFERLTLYGLTLLPRRKVSYGRVDPAASRAIFIRAALVEGDYRTDAPFFAHNRSLLAAVEELEHKSRRRDVLVDEETLFRFYDERLPADIHSGPAFEKWRRREETEDARRLFLTRAYLMRHGAPEVTAERFPDHLDLDGVCLPLSYRFEPGHEADGVTLHVPLPALKSLHAGRCEWLVPGLLQEKIIALIKSLPKSLRRHFVPAPDFAEACLQAMEPATGPLLPALAAHLQRMTGVAVPADAWQLESLADHLKMRFAVLDERGKELAAGRDLAELQGDLAGEAQASFRGGAGAGLERREILAWDFGDLPREVVVERQGLRLRGFPALVDQGEWVDLRVFDTAEDARRAHPQGLRRLFALTLEPQIRSLSRGLPGIQRLELLYAMVQPSPWRPEVGEGVAGAVGALRRDLILLSIDRACLEGEDDVYTAQDFARRREHGRARLVSAAEAVCALAGGILERYHGVVKALHQAVASPSPEDEINEQLRYLIYRGFFTDVPFRWLQQLPRYLEAIERRLHKLSMNPRRDAELAASIAPLWRRCLEQARCTGRAIQEYEPRWLLEELRVSLFAQELRTVVPVSVKRLEKLWPAQTR